MNRNLEVDIKIIVDCLLKFRLDFRDSLESKKESYIIVNYIKKLREKRKEKDYYLFNLHYLYRFLNDSAYIKERRKGIRNLKYMLDFVLIVIRKLR